MSVALVARQARALFSSQATSASAGPSRGHWRRLASRAVREPEACCRSSSGDFAGVLAHDKFLGNRDLLRARVAHHGRDDLALTGSQAGDPFAGWSVRAVSLRPVSVRRSKTSPSRLQFIQIWPSLTFSIARRSISAGCDLCTTPCAPLITARRCSSKSSVPVRARTRPVQRSRRPPSESAVSEMTKGLRLAT